MFQLFRFNERVKYVTVKMKLISGKADGHLYIVNAITCELFSLQNSAMTVSLNKIQGIPDG